MQYTIEKPYKMVTRNATFKKKISTFVRFLGQILENQCFRKMGVAGMKWGPRPPILYSFFRELNEEALLKVSLKNLHLFQSYPFFKNTTFSKMALKIYQKFCIHGNHFYRAFQWFVCFGTLSIPSEIEAFTAVKFHSPPTVAISTQ